MIKAIKDRFLILSATPEVLADAVNNLVLPNPEYSDRERLGYSTWNIPKELRFFKVHKEHVFLPREYRPNVEYTITKDNTVEVPANIPFTGQLRDYQEEPVQALMNTSGVLAAPTGTGKTVMALALISRMQQRTMVIVHKNILLKQWAERIKQFTGIEAGIIGQGKKENIDAPIVVATIQTLLSLKSKPKAREYFDGFGLVLGDECHRYGSLVWQKGISLFKARYRVGLSATPFRTDKMEKVIFWNFGPVKYAIEPRLKATVVQKQILEGVIRIRGVI